MPTIGKLGVEMLLGDLGNHHSVLDAEDLARRLSGLLQQTHVDDLVGDLLLDNQLVLGIDRNLLVVPNCDPGMA